MPLDIDRFAHVESPLQRWDPRYKLAGLGLVIISIALIKTLPAAAVAFILAALLLYTTSLPFHFVSHGLMFVIVFLLPFFLIMPFSYPGESAFYVLGLGFSWDGFRLATLIFTKAVAIVMISFSVFGSSRFDVSMYALQSLRCPTVIVQMLLFTYRYTFVFLEEMKRMMTSMRVRGFIPTTNMYTLKTYGNFVGTLLVRSFERTDRVYKAMLSKGYQGEFLSMVTFKANNTDTIKIVCAIFIAIALVIFDQSGFFQPAPMGWL